jgi:hypothetical protein
MRDVGNTLPYAWMLLLAGLGAFCATYCAHAQEEAATEQTAEPEAISPKHHPWARFPIGAWREVRIVEHTLDEKQQITGRSEILRTEHLRDVSPPQFTLEQSVKINVGGERIQSPPITVTLGMATDEPGTVQSFTKAPPESMALDGRDVEARVLIVETGGEAYTVRTRLSYAPDEPPYVLRSVSEAVVPASQETVWWRTRRVLARELPYQCRDEQFSATFWEEQHVSSKGTRHSIIVTAERIPGGLLTRWTKEMDNEGRLIRREVQTLLGWGVEEAIAD